MIIAAAAAVAVGGTGFFLMRDLTKTEPVAAHSASEYVIDLCNYALGDIASVTVCPPVGDEYTLLVSDGALVLAEDPSFPLRPTLVSLVANNICTVRGEYTVLDTSLKEVKLRDFGLDPAACTCSFQLTDGNINTIRIGKQISGGDIPYYYFMWNDDPRIFAGGTDMYTAFSYDRSFLHTVTQPSINTDLLNTVSVSGDNSLTLSYTDIGWEIMSPFRYPADSGIMEGFLKNVSGILFSRYIGPTSELDPDSIGLGDPSLTVVFTVAESILTVPDTSGKEHVYTYPETDMTFSFGSAYDEYNRYVEFDGAVYTATTFLTDFLYHTRPADLCLKTPFNLEMYQLKAIDVATSNENCRYEVLLTEQVAENGSLVTDESGNTLYDCTIRKDGILTDSEPFLSWYSLRLRSVVPAGAFGEVTPVSGEPAAVFTLLSETDSRTVSFYPSGLQYAMAVNGICLFYISSQTFGEMFPLP